MLLLWSVVSYMEMQHALQWWFKRQSAQLLTESEQIHNGLLQEVFAIRRSLELSLVDETGVSPNQGQDWLNKAEKLHQSLEQLSDTLSPPFLAESLPLAMQCMLERLQNQSGLSLEATLPSRWSDASSERNRIILMVLEELLKLALPKAAIEDTQRICLSADETTGELTVELTYPDLQTLTSLTQTKELKYLCCCFQCLAPGRCVCQKENLTVVWRFRWRLQEAYPLQ
jgi:hypothetical protein